MFLTSDQIVELTGYKRHADQRKWLADHGWTFEVAATGRPVVSCAFASHRLGGAESANNQWFPDVASLRKSA